jgi:mannose-1-phosphate guanylyltransferase/mannose-6-phosphate isomerase
MDRETSDICIGGARESAAGPGHRGAESLQQNLCITPVVLAGGSGTRLWPMSREHYPKQLIDVVGSDSLLQATVRRMQGFSATRDIVPIPIIVCGNEHRFITAEQLRESGFEARLVIEPVRRDTAPALTLAAALAMADGGDAILVAMPADHAIADVAAFQRAIAGRLRQGCCPTNTIVHSYNTFIET